MCIFKIIGVIICTSVWTKAVIHVEINEIDYQIKDRAEEKPYF